jgi:uncharacterized protein (TIGR02679 family)
METSSPVVGDVMAPTLDLPRLRATLGDPRLVRLVALLRRRLELGAPLTGSVTLTSTTAAERAASDELLGRRPTRGAALTIDLDALTDVLRAAGICDDLSRAVEGLLGPIVNRRAANRERESEWAALWHETQPTFASRPALAGWIDELERTGVVKRLSGNDPLRAAALMRDMSRIADVLPTQGEPLAVFAARLLGDAHALDPGSSRATLAVRAAAQLGAIEFQDDAEGRRAAWASVGVMCDELSTPALVFNLPATNDTPLGRLLRSAQADAEPLHLSLRLLLRHPLRDDRALTQRDVFVCENPTIVALAAARIGRGCAPLICVNGQFATPSLVLLRQLREAGAQLHYHGDFDPAGLMIARRAMAEGDARPWQFGAADYLGAPKGVVFAGEPGPTPWDPALRNAMQVDGRTVHEEAVFAKLAEDLARSHDRSK